MKRTLSRMNALLAAAVEGVGAADAGIGYEPQEKAFTLGQSGVEVVLEVRGNTARWRVREVYSFADLEEGGQRPIGATVAERPLGDEISVAKLAVLRMLELRIDGALDAVA